jgi:fumarate hydratase class II
MRRETDSLGEVEIKEGALWGAVTQRSLENFSIGEEFVPLELIYAIALVKKAAAKVNSDLKVISLEKAEKIIVVADEILKGSLKAQFPLKVWQTGSLTHSNMNVNEVIANRASQIDGVLLGSKIPLHPNDDVNASQSSNDVIPTAMHIAAFDLLEKKLLPHLKSLRDSLDEKRQSFDTILKVGRTHLMDAASLTLGEEFSAYVDELDLSLESIKQGSTSLLKLAIGGTAVGTGLNAPPEFGKKMVEEISKLTGYPFVEADNKFSALSFHGAVVLVSGSLRALAAVLMKIGNDIRWLASGPRCGLSELKLPANEPGSSIMPGKVNPTQCEALTQVAIQVMGNDVAIGFGGSLGNFELNVFKPVMIYNLIQSIKLLSDVMLSFRTKCVVGIEPNREQIERYLERSLMSATALNKKIGYDKASLIVKTAEKEGISLKAAAIKLKVMTEEEFEEAL